MDEGRRLINYDENIYYNPVQMNQFIQEKACSDCPFNESGPGRVLRDSLNEGRFESIKDDLLQGKTFPCHQTQSGKRWTKKSRVCAGALAFQRKNNRVPDAVQIAERLTAMRVGRRGRW